MIGKRMRCVGARWTVDGTDLVPTAVIEVMVCSNGGDDFDTGLLGGCLDFGDVVGVNCSRFVGRVVDEEVRVVVVADWHGYDLHSGGGGGREEGCSSERWCAREEGR